MSTSRPGPEGPGLDPSHDLEAARRRLYAAGGPSAADVAEYERLSAAVPAAREAPATSPPPPAEAAASTARSRSTPRRRRAVLLAGGVAVLLLVVAAIVSTRPALPQQVDVPQLAGTTLFAYGRALDPATGPDSITYQPEGYTVFQPRGRTVAVALRCVGRGTVRISAGPQFDFRCGELERTAVQRDAGPRSDPFIVMGTTVGNVVWSARIVLIDPPQTAGAIPSFRDSCSGCTVVGAATG